jgi:hypothetical protein
MHHYARVCLLLVAVALLSTSCADDDEDARLAGPSGLNTSTFAVSATSTTAFAQRVINPFCPSVAPFNVSFGLITRATGPSVVVISGIGLQFTDTRGRQAPQITLPPPTVTLPAPGPTQIFGTPTSQLLPVAFGIGCDTDPEGTVVVIVETSDGRRQRMDQQVRVVVR